MRAAVVGAGLFGCVAAVELAKAGHHVDLYERHRGILNGASRASLGRLHRGYHYPRSLDTALATLSGSDSFAKRFPAAVSSDTVHHYLIAEGSRTSAEDFLAFCDLLELPYILDSTCLAKNVELCVWVPEAVINVDTLRALLHCDLREHLVRVRLGEAGRPDMPGYDLTVCATYGRYWPGKLRTEVTEVAVVQLPAKFAGQSLVVLDGPFGCVDPLPGTKLHLLYHVEHSVHAVDEVPDRLRPLLDAGNVDTRHSRARQMASALQPYLDLGPLEHYGSLFTLRSVLPDVDDTDERPTLVRREGSTIHVLSGKLDTAITAALQVVAMARELVAA